MPFSFCKRPFIDFIFLIIFASSVKETLEVVQCVNVQPSVLGEEVKKNTVWNTSCQKRSEKRGMPPFCKSLLWAYVFLKSNRLTNINLSASFIQIETIDLFGVGFVQILAPLQRQARSPITEAKAPFFFFFLGFSASIFKKK